MKSLNRQCIIKRTCVWTKHEQVNDYSSRWNRSRCKVFGAVFREREKEWKEKGSEKVSDAGIEPATYRVWGDRDNHYTNPTCLLGILFLFSHYPLWDKRFSVIHSLHKRNDIPVLNDLDDDGYNNHKGKCLLPWITANGAELHIALTPTVSLGWMNPLCYETRD